MQILVEKDGQERKLTTAELEKELSFSYVPQLDFLKWAYFQSITKKTAKFHKEGVLSPEQLWLGVYFQNEILSGGLPPVRLRWIDDKVGWGVFAERDLKPLDYIGEYSGLLRKRKRADRTNAYCFEYVMIKGEGTRYTIDALDQGGIVRFINHSFKPNLMCGIATVHYLSHVILYAVKPILKGEQLLYDYGPDYWNGRLPPAAL
jgi:hypothetical protein